LSDCISSYADVLLSISLEYALTSACSRSAWGGVGGGAGAPLRARLHRASASKWGAWQLHGPLMAACSQAAWRQALWVCWQRMEAPAPRGAGGCGCAHLLAQVPRLRLRPCQLYCQLVGGGLAGLQLLLRRFELLLQGGHLALRQGG
jgi:hypothetical protein